MGKAFAEGAAKVRSKLGGLREALNQQGDRSQGVLLQLQAVEQRINDQVANVSAPRFTARSVVDTQQEPRIRPTDIRRVPHQQRRTQLARRVNQPNFASIRWTHPRTKRVCAPTYRGIAY